MQKQDVMYYVKIWFASDVIIFSTAILPASTLVLPGVVVIMSAFHVYSWNPFPFIHVQPEKGTPSGRDPLRREGTSAKAWLLKQVLWSIFHYLCRLQNNSSKLGMKGVTLLPEYPTSLFFCLLQLLSVIKDNNWLRSLQKRHLVLKSRMCFPRNIYTPWDTEGFLVWASQPSGNSWKSAHCTLPWTLNLLMSGGWRLKFKHVQLNTSSMALDVL